MDATTGKRHEAVDDFHLGDGNDELRVKCQGAPLMLLPVLAATLMHSRWAWFWTVVALGAWLLLFEWMKQRKERSELESAAETQ